MYSSFTAGKSNRCQFLIDRGASLEVTDALGQTPLHYAAKFGHESLVTKFVRSGANAKAKVKEIANRFFG